MPDRARIPEPPQSAVRQSAAALGSPGVGVAAPKVPMRQAHGPNGKYTNQTTPPHIPAFPFFGWRVGVAAFFFPQQKSESENI
jgi:hypothetical protein